MSLTDAFTLNVITPDGEVLSKSITYLRLPGLSGEIGIISNHTESISILGSGRLSYDDESGEESAYFIREGIAHIQQDKVLVLTPFIDSEESIDSSRATQSLKVAQERLDAKDPSIDDDRARAALKRATIRLSLLSD